MIARLVAATLCRDESIPFSKCHRTAAHAERLCEVYPVLRPPIGGTSVKNSPVGTTTVFRQSSHSLN